MAENKALPSSDMGRYITFNEVARTTETSVDTLFTWHRLVLAMGFDFGKKIRGVWNFSPHELFQFNIAASLSTAGHPVSMDALRQIFEATKDEGRPDGSLFLKTKSTFAVIAVHLPGLWDVLAHMLERAVDASEN